MIDMTEKYVELSQRKDLLWISRPEGGARRGALSSCTA